MVAGLSSMGSHGIPSRELFMLICCGVLGSVC